MKIAIIIGSTRQGRATPKVAEWVEKTANAMKLDAEFSIVDIKDFELPMFDEVLSPKYNPDRKPEGSVKNWLDTLADTDGYVFVTPEYNHSIPGSLKNALDFIDYQTNKKAALVVSHGPFGGTRATEHLRNIVSELGLVTTPLAVNLAGLVVMGDVVSDDSTLVDSESRLQSVLETALTSLVWYTGALKTAREE